MQASITMLMVGYVVILSVKLIAIFAQIRIMSHDDTNLTSDTVTSAQTSGALPSTILLLWFRNTHSEFDVLKLPTVPSADGPRSVMKRCCHVKQKTIFMRSWKTFYVLKHPI